MSAAEERLPIAVVGAGVAGLACARALRQAGRAVALVDKARGPGGRIATRRDESMGACDHGAQYWTARGAAFAELMRDAAAVGAVAPWEGRLVDLRGGVATPRVDGETRWTGTPRASAFTRWLAQGGEPRAPWRVIELLGGPGAWRLQGEDGARLGPFALVVCTAPAAQSAALLAGRASFAGRLAACAYHACWALMTRAEAPGISWDGAFVAEGTFSWAAREASKPGRAADAGWVLQAGAAWSDAHVDDEPAAAQAVLVAAARDELGIAVTAALAHRWRYARVRAPLGEDFLLDAGAGLAYAGDACLGARVEDAWRSGDALGRHMAAT